MIPFRARSFAVIAAATAVACAPMPAEIAEAEQTLTRSPSCCVDMTGFTFVPLQLDRRLDTALDKKSPIFAFPEGSAYFAAFLLPAARATDRLVTVYSPHGGHLPTAAYIDPVVLFLDASKSVIDRRAKLPLKYGAHGLFNDHHYETTLAVPSEAQYIVVYPDRTSTRPETAYSDNGTRYIIYPRPIGPLFIHVRLPRRIGVPSTETRG